MRRLVICICICLLLAATGCAVPAGADPAITVALVGDILLTDAVLGGRGADYPWRRVAGQLAAADLAIGNLETAASLRGSPAGGKQYTFRSHPAALGGAARAGMDVLSLANNHSMDYGAEALLDTINAVRAAGMQPVGAGRDATEAWAPYVATVRGLKVAVLACTRVVPAGSWVAGAGHPGLAMGWEAGQLAAAIRSARRQADAVIVLIHWGEELKGHPRPTDQELARELIAAGATVVAGHHPHVLQGLAWHGRSLVAYSLGNFIFTQSASPAGRETGILTVSLGRRGVRSARFTPLLIAAGQPRPMAPREGARLLERLGRLSRIRIPPSGIMTPPAQPFSQQ